MENREKIIGFFVYVFLFLAAPVSAEKFDVNYLNQLSGMAVEDAFEEIKNNKYISRNKNLAQAIYIAYNNRKDASIKYSITIIKSPVIEIYENEIINRGKDFYLAKNILHAFSNESLGYLVNKYENANNITIKINIIRILGGMQEEDEAQAILIMALEDTSFYDVQLPETDGKPLRICDEAYNQLILRYINKGVLRVISNSHSIETRNYHINLLMNRIDKSVF